MYLRKPTPNSELKTALSDGTWKNRGQPGEGYAWESEVDRRDEPLILASLAELERQKGVSFPAFYKEFLSNVRSRSIPTA